MNKSQVLLLFVCVTVLVTSCKKADFNKDSGTDNSTTEQISKIETSWDGISEKNESDNSSPKLEFAASPVMIKGEMDRVNQKYQEYLSNLGTGSSSVLRIGNWVGVIKNDANCVGYDEIEIYMDCEDNNSATKWDGSGGSYRPSTWVINSNARMKYCIVPGNDFHAYSDASAGAFRYAVLRVTTNFYSDAFETNRYYDNEDHNNANTAWYQPWSGSGFSIKGSTNQTTSIYRTYIDGNSLLSFHVFDAGRLTPTTFVQWPDFNGMSYGVFGCCIPLRNTSDPNYSSILYTDDEDANNFNYFSADEDVSAFYPAAGYSFDASNPLIAIVEGVYKAGGFFNHGGYIDTQMFLTKVR